MNGRGSADRPALTTPSPDEWRRLGPLLDTLLDTPPERRATVLSDLSGGDEARRAELERLLADCEREYSALERPAADRFASVFGDEMPEMPELFAERYQVVREVGRGGMAVVYLARDLKHGRDVAVKVVRPELAAALGNSRFLREIRIAARLRHPNIVPLYDSGEHSTSRDAVGRAAPVLYYVMPYEPGRSLRERLAEAGPLPVADVLLILRDVCDALAHAHRHGIVHRDIKPGNVLLSGKHAMIADFGVAHAVSEAWEDVSAATPGLAVGTPAYMAPEQAANDPGVDHRADLYAVGVLAYELLEGHPPYDGAAGPHSGASRTPDESIVPSFARTDVPESLTDLIARCLARRPADRWQSADELLAQLSTIAGPATGPTHPALRRQPARVVMLTAGALALIGIVAIPAALTLDKGEPAPLALGRASQLTSESGLEVQPSVSPDGNHVAYAAGNSLHMRIVVRPAAGGRAVHLTTGTSANEWLPRWSPDGERILFLSRGGVHSVPASGGAAREEVPGRPGAIVRSATWSPDGREIAYVRGDSLLARAVDSKRERLIATGNDLHSCTWSPDAARFACVSGNSFYITVGPIFGAGAMFGNLAPSRIVLIPAEGGRPASVTDSSSLHQSPAWSPDGQMLYYVSDRQGPRDVYAIDLRSAELTDDAPLRVTTGMGAHSVALSADGRRVVYAAYSSSANIWAMPIPTDTQGSPAPAVRLTSGNQTIEGVRVSPDGRWLVYDSDLAGNSDVYRMPVSGGEAERLTRDSLDEFRGVLSPDGRELVYHTFRTGARNLFLKPLDGRPAQQITQSPGQRSMASWSPDGTMLALFDMTATEVLVMRRDTRGRWSPPRRTGGSGWRPEWSPDGRMIAFVSPTDGRIGIVSADSGRERHVYVPRDGDPLAELAIFSASGEELYFKSHDASGRASFWSIPSIGGRPRLLALLDDPERASNRFEFASDGKRFYFTVEDRQSDIWVAEAGRR